MGTSTLAPFEPRSNATINIAAGPVSVPVRFNDTSAFPGVPCVRVWNSGSEIVFVEFGGEDVIATEESSMPIPPGLDPVIFRPGGSSWIAAITHANSSVVYVTPGFGS